jgi:FixJ family two-component response regulator
MIDVLREQVGQTDIFRSSLPPFGRLPAETARGQNSEAANLPNRKVVLVVDDDPSMLRCVKRLLREHGFEAILFDSAQALRSHDDFDACCVILDINLSDGSGIDLRNQLKATGILLPVIFITGNDNDRERLAALQSGCIAYLIKPFSAKSLIEPLEMAASA